MVPYSSLPLHNSTIFTKQSTEIFYLLTFLGNLTAFTNGSLLSRHFFPIPINPCAVDRLARVSLSLPLSGLFNNLSAELRVVRDNRLSGRGAGVGLLVVAVIGVVERVSGLGSDGWVVGGEVRSVVGFWSRPLHTWNGN